MKRDINYAIMGLLLMVLLSFAAFSVYYQYTFRDLGRRYTNARGELVRTSLELNRTQHELEKRDVELVERERTIEQKENVIDEYFSALNLSRQRESSLGDMFNQIRTENALLAKSLSDTQNELDKTVKDFNELTKSFNKKAAQLETIGNLFGQVDASLVYMRDRMQEIRFEANDLDDTIDEMDDPVKQVQSNAVREELQYRLDDLEVNIVDLIYALNKLESKMNDTEYYAGRIRDIE